VALTLFPFCSKLGKECRTSASAILPSFPQACLSQAHILCKEQPARRRAKNGSCEILCRSFKPATEVGVCFSRTIHNSRLNGLFTRQSPTLSSMQLHFLHSIRDTSLSFAVQIRPQPEDLFIQSLKCALRIYISEPSASSSSFLSPQSFFRTSIVMYPSVYLE
jgi:hypothetical protein